MAKIFGFENFWVDQPGFLEIVQMVWNSGIRASNSVAKVTAKLKLLRRVLNKWAKRLSQIKKQIHESNLVIAVMDRLEENRPLFLQERNFRQIIKNRIQNLFKYQKEYWRKMYTVRWTKLGDENTSFFSCSSNRKIYNQHHH
jgi:hypothetical protein